VCITSLWSSNRFPDHEKAVGQVALDMGFTNVSLSSEVIPMVRIVPRGFTGKYASCIPILHTCIHTILFTHNIMLYIHTYTCVDVCVYTLDVVFDTIYDISIIG